jgi:mycofactocin precursor
MTQTTPPTAADPSVTDAETPAPAQAEPTVTPDGRSGDELVEADLLVEDVSIDGMCGVY